MSRLDYYFDFGNTRAKFWRCRDGREEAHWAGPHEGFPEALLSSLPSEFGEVPAGLYGASVLGGDAERRFAVAARERWGRVPEFARTEASFGGLVNGYRTEPEKLGIDRWLGIIGAASECDVFCVVGCGTAITIDVVTGARHQGGYILPGLRLMQDALLTGTQKVRFEQESPFALGPGTSTAEAVRNAALTAVVATVERVARDEGVSRVVLTGGDADTVRAFLQLPCQVEPGLLLKGMMRYFAHRNGTSMQGAPNEVGG